MSLKEIQCSGPTLKPQVRGPATWASASPRGFYGPLKVGKHWPGRLTNSQCVPWGKPSFPWRARQTPSPAAKRMRSSRWFLEHNLSTGSISTYPHWASPGRAGGGGRARTSRQRGTGITQLAGLEQRAGGLEALTTPPPPTPGHWPCSRIPALGEECGQSLRVPGQGCPEVHGSLECLLVDRKWPEESD